MSFTKQDVYDFLMHEEELPAERWNELVANDALRGYILTKWSASKFSKDSEDKTDEALTEWLLNSPREDRVELWKILRG